MAHTVELLSLIEDYPDAFVEPSEAPMSPPSTNVTQPTESSGLMALISEFPEAFAEPDTPPAPEEQSNVVEGSSPTVMSSDLNPTVSEVPSLNVPAGYEMALCQTISTFGWGTIEVFLSYGDQGLQSLWLTVGKSGTEVQSFCEAIARLTNKLLAAGTSIPDLVKELRGIRGGDSEGLGPHRFLGLVDLFGKILQEAPATLATLKVNASDSVTSSHPVAQDPPVETSTQATTASVTAESVSPSSSGHQWVALSDTSAIAALCPECGAELQQVNGCSGGACVVCGYSSCS